MKQTNVFLSYVEGDAPLVEGIIFENINTSTSSLFLFLEQSNSEFRNFIIRNITSKGCLSGI